MTERWEYLVVIWRETCQKLSEDPPEFEFKRELFVYRHGRAEPEQYLLWSSNGEEESSDRSMLQILNDLGAEGWELVTDALTESVIGYSSTTGWPEAGRPVLRQLICKRRA